MDRTALGELVWHPHQKLWNWRLQAAVRRAGRPLHAANALVNLLIAVDSMLLLARVVGARVVALGPLAAWSALPPTARTVGYVDCGLHKRGEQVRCMREWFGDRCDLAIVGI